MTPQSPDDARELYTIPSSSSWFAWDEIHDKERRSLPEFFDGHSISRNPRVYKEYRDFIINKYREDPSRRLTFTEIRKSLVGDVGSIHKVFLFLDRWGLVNFGARTRGPTDGGIDGPVVVVEEGVPGGVQVVPAPMLFGLASGPVGAAGENGFKLPPLTSYSDVFGDWMPRRGPVCGVCGEQCTPGVSESMKHGGFVTCSKCSKNNNYEEGKSADDSKSKDQSDAGGDHVTSSWTDAETLLLLEAVLKHGEDWDLIAQHVRTKSKLDCIARLIQLPFGEHMLGTINSKPDNKNPSSQTVVEAPKHGLIKLPQEHTKEDGQLQMDTNAGVAGDSTPIHPSKRGCFPFLDATDSLMKQVALLSTVAGPHIAAAAAEAAVRALCNENPYAEEVFDINENDVGLSSINYVGLSSINIAQGMESDIKVEDSDMERHEQTDMLEPDPDENFATMTFRIRAAVATALGATAARAKIRADQEEREMEHLMASIIETQMRKIQYKMKHFEELELIMEKEFTHIQQMKDSVLEEWVGVLQQAFHAGIPRWRDQGLPRSLLNSSIL